jgi:endonuclease YncB( thermonuclease family)
VSETDRFNRLLRYVFLADGTHVNAELVRQGYAQVATFPPDVSREAEMRAAEAEARMAGRGLWATGERGAGAATAGAANLRSGPGTNYAVVRTLPAGDGAGADRAHRCR